MAPVCSFQRGAERRLAGSNTWPALPTKGNLMTVSKITLAVALATSALVSAPAFAQDAPEEFTITGTVGGVSDYRFRGISQTNEDFAVQGSINLNHSSGFYVGTWASNVDFANSSEEIERAHV